MSSDIAEAVAAIITERGAVNRADWEHRQAADEAFRAERKRARGWGLAQRHAAKLARNASG